MQTGIMYGVEVVSNGPGIGEPGGMTLFSLAHCAAFLIGGASVISAAFNTIFMNKLAEAVSGGSSYTSTLNVDDVFALGWFIYWRYLCSQTST